MNGITLYTFDWVPETPRGYVRDLRVRWALEEAQLPYRVIGVPFEPREATHLAQQPFGQVPWLVDGKLSIFESGAILLHLGEQSEKLMPRDSLGRKQVIEWIFAALNSVEMAGLPWAFMQLEADPGDSPIAKVIERFLAVRLQHMDKQLGQREWLTRTFSIADILMADVLRLVHRFDGLKNYPACRAYVQRATSRPAFRKAHADQLAHFAAADATRSKS